MSNIAILLTITFVMSSVALGLSIGNAFFGPRR